MVYIIENIYKYDGKLYYREEKSFTRNPNSRYYGQYEWTPIKKVIWNIYKVTGDTFLLDCHGFDKIK